MLFFCVLCQGFVALSAERRIIHVMGSRSFPPYVFIDEKGRPSGFDVDLLRAVSDTIGMDVQIDLVSWDNIKDLSRRRKTDLFLGTSFSRGRRELLDGSQLLVNTALPNFSMDRFLLSSFHDVSGKDLGRFNFFIPTVNVPFSCFTRDDNSPEQLRDVFGGNIAVLRGSDAGDYLERYNVTQRRLYADSSAEVLYTIITREADYALLGTYQGQYLIEKLKLKKLKRISPPLFRRDLGLIVTGGDIYLVKRLFEGLEVIRQNGTYDRIYRKWFAQYDKKGLDRTLIVKIVLVSLFLILLSTIWTFSLKRRVARIVREREKIIDFTRDGIIAVDGSGKLSLINDRARRLVGLKGDVGGKHVDDYIPELGLTEILRTGEVVHDEEQNLRGTLILANKAPIMAYGEIVGAVSTFRDLTEIRAMAEEITGVKMYVESLRVQNHEFLNKLQAVSGLIQLGRYQRAVDFISAEQQGWQSTTSFVSEHIKNPAVGGILVGKIGRCKELGIECCVDPDSSCGESDSISDQILVIIIGNLLENAIDAVRSLDEKQPRIEFAIFDESRQIMISVRDNGVGIETAMVDSIFKKGFSTKRCGKSRGYGLYNVKKLIEALEGDISLDSMPGEYTEFMVTLPNGGK